jgi:hypothetical protein
MTLGAGDDGGFGLAEVLTAAAIIAIGLMATAVAFQQASSGIEAGRGETTAIFMAEQRIEALKAVALVDWSNVALDSGTTTEYCHPANGCGTTPLAGLYRRTTTVAENPGGICAARCRTVEVSVFYRPLSARGQFDEERRIDVFAMFVARA